MAYSSVNFDVAAGDQVGDWVQVATNPVFLKIRVRDGVKWQLAVTTGAAPVAATGFTTHQPDQTDDGWEFQQLWSAATVAAFFVRAPQQRSNQGTIQFGVIRDQ